MNNILYLHGMGGGEDSRVPAILAACLPAGWKVIIHTYDFDPEIASVQIGQWLRESQPVLVIGESLGSIHALCIKDLPRILLSPALNAPLCFGRVAPLASLPFLRRAFEKRFSHPGERRQQPNFDPTILRKWPAYRKKAIDNADSSQTVFAVFGRSDHYRRSGIVSFKTWERSFGRDSYVVVEGNHYPSEECIRTLLLEKILSLGLPAEL